MNSTIFFGIVGVIINLIYRLLWNFIPLSMMKIPFGTSVLISSTFSILIIIGMIGISYSLIQWKEPILILYAIQILFYVFVIINPLFVTPLINDLITIFLSIPGLMLFYQLKFEKIALGLFILKIIRTIIITWTFINSYRNSIISIRIFTA